METLCVWGIILFAAPVPPWQKQAMPQRKAEAETEWYLFLRFVLPVCGLQLHLQHGDSIFTMHHCASVH